MLMARPHKPASPASCATKVAAAQPSASPIFPYVFALEALRAVLVWTAFALLATGYAFGGEEEIQALE